MLTEALAMQVVLVVDDDALSRHVLLRRLHRWGYRPEGFATGEEALRHLRRHGAAALVADVEMPGMDGLALARVAREAHPDLPVFLVTPQPQPALWKAAAAAGAADLLPKKTGSADGLRLALERALDPTGAPQDDVALAHSLRTPLTALKGALDILCSGPFADESHLRFAGIAQRNVDRMIGLVEELLESAARP